MSSLSYPNEVYLAYFFSGEGYADANTGLQIAASLDGKVFQNIAKDHLPIFTPKDGLRDPHILYYQNKWYLIYSYGPDISCVIFLAESTDLLQWTQTCTLRMAQDSPKGSNYIDVPSWVVDEEGHVHIIACVDHNHHWTEIHPNSDDSGAWGDPNNWSDPVEMTDNHGQPLIQGNTFVTLKDGTFYMAANSMQEFPMYMRTSKNIASGWSQPYRLHIYAEDHKTESENLIETASGALRFYISSSNSLQYKMWYIESDDLGVSWTEPTYVQFQGVPHRVNWSQFSRITDRNAISLIIDSFMR